MLQVRSDLSRRLSGHGAFSVRASNPLTEPAGSLVFALKFDGVEAAQNLVNGTFS
jgi:hypothetical protein